MVVICAVASLALLWIASLLKFIVGPCTQCKSKTPFLLDGDDIGEFLQCLQWKLKGI